jgi:hypothetical protein
MLRVATGFALLTGMIGYRPKTTGYIDLVKPLTFEEQCEYQRLLRDFEYEEDLEADRVRYRCRGCGGLGHNTRTCGETYDRSRKPQGLARPILGGREDAERGQQEEGPASEDRRAVA